MPEITRHLECQAGVPGVAPELRLVIRSCFLGWSPWPLTLSGESGSGKTCAALVIIDLIGGLYHTAASLVDDVREARFGRLQHPSGHTKSDREVWREWTKARVAVLDEMGTRESTDFHLEVVKRAIDLRYGRPLVCVSNLGLQDLQAVYDDRVVSRLGGGTVAFMEGDRRADQGHVVVVGTVLEKTGVEP